MNYQQVVTDPNLSSTDNIDPQAQNNFVFYQQAPGMVYMNNQMPSPYVGYPIQPGMAQMGMQANTMPVGMPANNVTGPKDSVPQTRFNENLFCKSCKRTVLSQVRYEKGKGTYFASTINLLFGCWAGCCLIPCCAEDCLDAKHFCSSCGREMGVKKFLFEGK